MVKHKKRRYDRISTDKSSIIRSINLSQNGETKEFSSRDNYCAISYLKSSALKSDRLFENSDCVTLFSGDLIGYDSVPWKKIFENAESLNFDWFSNLRGNFAIAIINKKKAAISNH
jgi:hypothetical protein